MSYNRSLLLAITKESKQPRNIPKKRDKVVNYGNKKVIPSMQGYKQGAPPSGYNYMIPSDTLYNPTPYNIKATSDTGETLYLNPFDETPQTVEGANYFIEEELPTAEEGGWLDRYKRGGGYFPEYDSWAPPRMYHGGYISDKAQATQFGQYQNGGLLPKAQIGKQLPPKVYTNYPEYIKAKQAFDDSLFLHNTTIGAINKLRSADGLSWKKYVNDHINKGYSKKMISASKRLKNAKPVTIVSKNFGTYYDPKRSEYYTGSGTAVEYKKPVQPVVYQKPIEQPDLKMVGQDRVQNNAPSFNFAPPRLSTIEKPKGSYAVDYFNEKLEPQTNYFSTPELADMFLQEKMKDKMYGPSMTRRGNFKNGGDISIPDLKQNNWLDKYK